MRRARVVLVGNKPKSDSIELVALGRTTKFVIDNNQDIRLVQPDSPSIMLFIPG